MQENKGPNAAGEPRTGKSTERSQHKTSLPRRQGGAAATVGAVAVFVACVFNPEDIVEVRRIPNKKAPGQKVKSSWCTAKLLAERVEGLTHANQAGDNIYVGVNPRKKVGGKAAKDVLLARCIFADFDHIDVPEVRERLDSVGLPAPTIIIASGHGAHAYWRLVEPITDLAVWASWQEDLIAAVGSDNIKDPPRVMRLPGFMNLKSEPHVPCTIVEADPTRVYDLADLRRWIPIRKKASAEAKCENGPAELTRDSTNQSAPPSPGLDGVARAARYLAKIPGAVQGKKGDNRTYQACCVVTDFALNDDQALTLLREWNRLCKPPWSEPELRAKLEHARKYRQSPVGSKLPSVADDWEPPTPLGEFELPAFPLESMPNELRGLWGFCAAVAKSYQVPADMPVLLAFSVAATALAKRIVVHVRGDHYEPVNIFMTVVLPPAERKSAVFRVVLAPLVAFEQCEAERLAPEIERSRSDRVILESRLKYVQTKAAKVDEPERTKLTEEARELAEELRVFNVIEAPRLVADDATPERLSTLLRDHGGRMALMSPEGDVFDLMAGRYSDKGSNLGVYLKGHAGDDLRVDRVGRPPEFVREPALTIGLTIQPDVLRGLMSKPGFRGRGLLGRFGYSLPKSLIGQRELRPAPVSAPVSAEYARIIDDALALRPATAEDGTPTPHAIRPSPEALDVLDAFARGVERSLGDDGEFSSMRDWAGKVVGLVCRYGGILHGLIHAKSGNPARLLITRETMTAAVAIGRYFSAHAKAAYFEMGSDPAIDLARCLLAWIRRHEHAEFSRRDAHQAVKHSLRTVEEIDAPLALLASHGYVRPVELKRPISPGRSPSPRFEVNPSHVAQYPHNPQKGGDARSPEGSEDSEDIEPRRGFRE